MKKALFIVSFIAIIMAFGVSQDMAIADEASVFVSVQIDTIASFTLDPSDWPISGPITFNQVVQSDAGTPDPDPAVGLPVAPHRFTVTNTGTVPEDFTIQSGDSNNGWSCLDSGAALNTFTMYGFVQDDLNFPVWIPICDGPVATTGSLPRNDNAQFDLRFHVPTDSTPAGVGVVHSINVTIIASPGS